MKKFPLRFTRNSNNYIFSKNKYKYIELVKL